MQFFYILSSAMTCLMFESAVVLLIRLASTFPKYLTQLLVLLQLFDFKVIVMIGIKIYTCFHHNYHDSYCTKNIHSNLPEPNFVSYFLVICLAAHTTVLTYSLFFCAVHFGDEANCVDV